MDQSWSILPLLRSEALPLLLVKFRSEASSYTIHLTDLIYVWSETLDRRQIIRRALNDETSIDPSEGADQLKILLQKIGEALRGEQQTSFQLGEGGKEKALLLSVVAQLPAPLRPLTWSIHLEPTSQEKVTSELILPSLAAQLMQRSQISFLLGQIKEKDHVIGRVLDKLESSGIELSSVFPGTVGLKQGKKGSGREKAAKYVKGLGAFDEERWLNETAYPRPPLSSQQKLVQEVFATSNSMHLPQVEAIDNIELLTSWWTILNDRPIASAQGIVNVDTASSANYSDSGLNNKDKRRVSEMYDDEFQRQATPPSLQSPAGRTTPVISSQITHKPAPNRQSDTTHQDDETTDEDEEHQYRPKNSMEKYSAAESSSLNQSLATLPSPEADLLTATTTTPKPRRKVGVIGGRKTKSVSPKPNDTRDHNASWPVAEARESTASGRDTRPSPTVTSEHHHEQVRPPGLSTSYRRLGIIGGKKEHHTPTEAALPSGTALSQPASNTVHGNLGTIGGKGRAESRLWNTSEQPLTTQTPSTAGSDDPRTLPAATTGTQKEPSPTTETAQEKADRKREELKRQLVEKAKAPVKRQRRF
ncbi:MAG: hypothetical protein M1835_002443 [Candelina submexicana]|nr:MAG: hypothetical protein M1835_002443 [Candelina submexicana]